MAFDTLESSDFLGRPVRLYSFRRGDKFFYFNNGDRDISAPGPTLTGLQAVVWTSTTIGDSGLKQKEAQTSDDFTITAPISNPVCLAFVGTPPSQPIKAQVRIVQYGDTDAPLIYSGYVSSVKMKDGVTNDIICNTQVAYLARKGLRMTYQRACPHQLYDDDCKVNKASYVEAGTIRSLSGNAFQFDLVVARPDLYSSRFTNGFVEWNPDPLYTERRSIFVHNADLLLLLNYTDGLSVGQKLNIYPGCQRTPNNCKLFNNIENYGGFPFLPGVSPFDGNPVF